MGDDAQERFIAADSALANDSAEQLWEQIFARLASLEDAAVVDSPHFDEEEETRIRVGLAQAGWSDQEIDARIAAYKAQLAAAPVTSPGVYPHSEFLFDWLCTDVEAAMSRLGFDSHTRVARGVEPRVGPMVSLTNVIMTNESIVTVGTFLFRFCGLVARAFVRTLHLSPVSWESEKYTDEGADFWLAYSPDVMRYWVRIYLSFGATGTHALVPFLPARRHEVVFEQVARAMEIFALAHEYSHHHLGHGRNLENDPKQEEFEADQLALRICYEVERKPLLYPNPYLSSGAGGLILLLALQTLRHVRETVFGIREEQSNTHPDLGSRLLRFESVAVLKPAEFRQLKSFRMVSKRIMDKTSAEVLKTLSDIPTALKTELRCLAKPAGT